LIKDSQLEDTVKKVDFVLVGADRIYPDKWFLNKVKTKRLVRAARKNSIPIFILALKEKIQKEKDSRNKKLTTFRYDKNLFEKIELRLIDEIFLA
jgi:translation initiation factor 2B subunit (eIF-2B alpha/beta/delta family)